MMLIFAAFYKVRDVCLLHLNKLAMRSHCQLSSQVSQLSSHFLWKCVVRVRLGKFVDGLSQTWANYGPRAKSGPPVLLFWPAGTYTNLNSHREFNGRPFFL